MKGGKADKLTLPQIAKKHGVPIEDLMSQFKLGIKTEMEHTDNKKQAKEIAMDHLAENPKYYTKLKKAKLEEAIGKSLATAALGLSLIGNPSASKPKQSISQQQTQRVLAKVNFSRSEPISNPDLDLVHGALGSKRLNDDFSQRVTNELENQINKGNTPDVSNIEVSTYIQGNQIITEASCDIIQSQDGIAYANFTTRGSIGDDYVNRHDEQVTGLVDRLEKIFGGVAKQVGKTFTITFQVNGQTISYKQSFFVASDSKQSQTISGKDFTDLRQKLKDQTKDISIDPNSIEINIDNFSISYKLGNEKIKVISLIYDNAGQLENRLISVKNQNPTLEVLEKGKSGNVDWAVSVIKADDTLKEEKIPSKLKSDIQIEYHKKLNPQFWLNNHLKSNIRKNLLNLAKFYFKQLDLGVELKDIIFTGSLANYNYTDLSDIDIHIIIDYKKLTNDDEFAKEFFSNKRSIWADSNEIKVNGFPVEIYVQDVSQLDDKGMGSMYSLLDNKWIKKPKYKLPQVDKNLITTKVNKYLDILNKISMMDDSIKKVEAYNKVFEKMRTDRKKATQKEGEFSIDNLVFKVLRNKGVFDIIKNNKKEIVNNLFSMKTN
jgi:predicted nucleotidyltransferase